MKIKIKKNNIFSSSQQISQKGIALLFAVFLSTIFLTIALGVLSIATKELSFSTSAKDSNDAFFAADSVLECALFNDKEGSGPFAYQEEESKRIVNCFNQQIEVSGTFPEFNLIVSDLLGNGGNSCAKVSVFKDTDGSEPPTVLATRMISKGYNTGDGDCYSEATNRIERVLEINY